MEKAPQITQEELYNAVLQLQNLSPKVTSLVSKINDEYEYWDTVKYKKMPKGCSAKDIWSYVIVNRIISKIEVWKRYNIHFSLTNRMQQLCHEFDMNFGGSWESSSIIPDEHKERYLVSSLMEEAISSSQMEGAATTRKVAKEMLRKNIQPRGRSQQMIYNNYQTIQFIVQNRAKTLTSELLLHIHKLMTNKTLENVEDEGRFRNNDEVVVENGITHEVVHIPPSFKEIPEFVEQLCDFFNANSTEPGPFIHPIIKGIIIHFMLAYVHPFVDGNGRTARALFYWYMLKKGYWLTEYLSISRIIDRSKQSYEKSFLYTEADNNDIGYFVAYNLRVINLAFKELQLYIKRKINERKIAATFLQIPNINERQAEIIKLYYDNSKEMLTVRDLQAKFLVTATTAKSDIVGLVNRGILKEVALNKIKKGYIKGDNFEEEIKSSGL